MRMKIRFEKYDRPKKPALKAPAKAPAFGLILTEALVAIASLTLGVVALGTVITNATSTTKVSKDYLLAQNLATEAIETVKNIRDSNWLIQPSRRECWLVLNPRLVGNCVPESASVGSNYIAIFDDDENKWSLQTSGASGELDLAANVGTLASQDPYRLYIEDRGGVDFYVNTGGASGTASSFYRNIKFSEIDPDNDFANLEITLQWFDGAKVRTIKQDAILYNHLE